MDYEDNMGRRWWWMDRNNKFHDVPIEGHGVWAERFLKKIHYPLNHHDRYTTKLYYIMYSLGFIRVGIVLFDSREPTIVYEYDLKNPPDYHKIDLIKQLGTEYGIKWITDGIRNKKDRIMEGKLTKTLKRIIHKTIRESMFPKDFKRHNLGTCMSAAALAADYFLKKGIKNFKIVEGFVSMYPDQEEEEWSPHTWIEFDDGRKFDPTKKQWEKWGFKVEKTKYERVTKTYTPEQYIKLCQIQGDGVDEVIQKNIKANINIPPKNMRYDDKGNLKFNKLTLDNLKALREKSSRSWRYWIKHANSNNAVLSMKAYMRYDAEIKRRLLYINKPVKEIRLEPPVDNEVREDTSTRPWKAWWMEPSGKIYEVYKTPNYGHWAWAKNYCKHHGLNEEQASFELMEKGWVRLTYNYYRDKFLHFDRSKTRQLGEKTMSEIKNLAIELGAIKLMDDNFNKEISLLQENLQETMTYDELLQLTAKTPRSPEDDTNRIDRSKTVNVRSLPVSVEDDGEQWNFRYKSSPQSTVTNEPFEGHITFLKGGVDSGDDAAKLECKVDCGCPDYMYKFAFNNYAQGAGDVGPGSENNAINRRPKPAYDIGEGLCKHLVALGKYLQTKIAGTKKQNIFEAVDDVAKQGPFSVTYYD